MADLTHSQGAGTIARNVHAVLRSFSNLTSSIGDVDQKRSFEDESTRFNIWAGNLGAHQSGGASLDYRLREAPHLHQQVAYLLEDLTQSLDDALLLVNPSTLPKTLDQHDPDPVGEDGFTDSEDEETSPERGLTGLSVDVKEAIDCLLRLSVAIANPVPHERVRTLGLGPVEDVSYRETSDIGYVQDKFPGISYKLATALGKALTRRRQFFKYRDAHRQRLASGLDNAGEADTSRTEVVPMTVASSLPEHLKVFTDLDLRTGFFDEDNRSDVAWSATSYATSVGLLAGNLEGQAEDTKPPPPLRVPPLPLAAEHGPFECPFCYRMVIATTRAAWKQVTPAPFLGISPLTVVDVTFSETFVPTPASSKIAPS